MGLSDSKIYISIFFLSSISNVVLFEFSCQLESFELGLFLHWYTFRATLVSSYVELLHLALPILMLPHPSAFPLTKKAELSEVGRGGGFVLFERV